MIAALFVHPTGPYVGRPDVDAWTEARDARLYAGPWSVVGHPPCASWGRYAKPTPESTAKGPLLGDDGGCFASGLVSVCRWGGVLEHPADSTAFAAHGIAAPSGAWRPILLGACAPAWVCCVEQGHYGHAARKPTWLLYVGTPPPELRWGESSVAPRPGDSPRRGILERMSKRQRCLTPPAFVDVLLDLARHARAPATLGA
jgi:hypothetical protein